MIISSTTDYREAARRRLPPFLFHYVDGGAYAEHTLGRNVSDLAHVALRQRVLQKDMSNLELGIELFGEKLSMPVALSPVALEDYIGYLTANFDPSICWKDLEWIREFWTGPMVVKGILDPEDAREAVRFGADGIIVSNHGGRQLDGVLSTARALPVIADAVKGQIKILVDSGIRTGLDVVRMLALGADCTMIGRAYIYALAAAGEAGVENLLTLMEKEMRVAMTLTGARTIADITPSSLVPESD